MECIGYRPWEDFVVPMAVLSMLNDVNHCHHCCRCRWSVAIRVSSNLSDTKMHVAIPIPPQIWCSPFENTVWLLAEISLQRNETRFHFKLQFSIGACSLNSFNWLTRSQNSICQLVSQLAKLIENVLRNSLAVWVSYWHRQRKPLWYAHCLNAATLAPYVNHFSNGTRLRRLHCVGI